MLEIELARSRSAGESSAPSYFSCTRTGTSALHVAAASLGCRFATAYRAVTMQGRLVAGEWLAVSGCGGVGLSAVMIGASLGARVVAVDVSPPALAAARDAGAELTVDGTIADRRGGRSGEATGGGAHLTVDALGSRATATAAIGSLRKRGRHVQVGLLVGDDARPPLPMELVIARGARDPRQPWAVRAGLPGDARGDRRTTPPSGAARRPDHRPRRGTGGAHGDGRTTDDARDDGDPPQRLSHALRSRASGQAEFRLPVLTSCAFSGLGRDKARRGGPFRRICTPADQPPVQGPPGRPKTRRRAR